MRDPHRLVDLHAHTTASDGTLAPAELVAEARRAGLAALAVTDHDSLAGLPEARAAGERAGVEIVSGIELSVHDATAGDVHLLAYLVDERDAALQRKLAELRDARARRGDAMVEKLRSLGIHVVVEPEPGAAVGRPHVARALIAAGVVASVQEAFDRYLAEGRPAFVPKAKLSGAEAIGLTHAAGGVAVLAHAGLLPAHSRLPLVRGLAALGLDGVEVMHPRNDARVREELRGLAGELRLVQTGGSDYHGENKPDVRLGMEKVPYAVLDDLRRARDARRSSRLA